MKIWLAGWMGAALLPCSAPLLAAQLECIVPSKPGGAMDLTCKLAKNGLQALPGGAPGQASQARIS